MTPQAQRIAIAEACGWHQTPHGAWTRDPAGIAGPHVFDTPDYLSDLNAMHEAEKVLTDDQFSHYGWTMLQSEPNIECRRYLSATASQRAEAFLRTLNLWDDTK